jgi:hypothetical protein
MARRRDRLVLDLLEQPPKLRLWSEAHGSICVQEGEPNLRRTVGDPDGGLSHLVGKLVSANRLSDWRG